MAKSEKTQAELYREERKARLAKAAKKNSKKQISSQGSKIAGRIISVILVLAIVAGLGTVVVKQAGIVEKSRAAFNVGEEKVSQAEYQYYYMFIYNRMMSMNQQYSQYGMSYASIDSSVAPSQQEYDNSLGEIENFPKDQKPTWADYISYSAKETICSVKAGVAAAKALNIELTDEKIAEVDSQIEQYRTQAESYSQTAKYSLSSYLKANYGKGMNEKLFRNILLEQQLVTALQEAKTEEFRDDFTAKQISKEYKDNVTTYGVVTFRSYTVKAETVEDKESGSSAVNDKTMKAAKEAADTIAAATTEDEFKSFVADNEKANKNENYADYIKNDSLTLHEDESISSVSATDEAFTKWFSAADTAVGSTYVVENSQSGYTVYMMVNPIHKAAAYETYDSRHILVNFVENAEETASEANDETQTTSEETETTAEETIAAETTAAAKQEVDVKTLDISKYKDITIDLGVDAETAQNKEGYKKAQEVLEKYLNGERTAEAFGELAHEYSEDTGSNEKGGLYEGTKPGDFVPAYEEWCMKDGRKEGDVGIVENIGSYKGYHIIYFVGKDTVKWDDPVKDNLAAEKYSEYAEEIAHGDNVKISGENAKTISSVTDFLDGLVKSAARNSAMSDDHDHDHESE